MLYTAERLIYFGYQYSPSCFCGYHLKSSEHLFFSCPLFQSGLDWIQCLLFLSSPSAPSISVRHALFGFSSDDLRCVPRVFSCLLDVCKFLVWAQRNDYRFRSTPPGAPRVLAQLKQCLCFFSSPLFQALSISSVSSVFPSSVGCGWYHWALGWRVLLW